MAWNKKAFDELRKYVKQSISGKPSPVGVPFYIFVYRPEDETICIREFKNFAKQLKNDGFKSQVIYLGQVLAKILDELPYLSPDGKEIEKRERSSLKRELSKWLPKMVAEKLLNGIDNLFIPLAGMRQDSVTFFLRTGALFPFVHISQILALLEGKTYSTIVVAFPGSLLRKQTATLSFLYETEGTYYRAVVLGG